MRIERPRTRDLLREHLGDRYWRDEDFETIPETNRLAVTKSALQQLLGVDRQYLKLLFRLRKAHEVKRRYQTWGRGLAAEEISGLLLGIYLGREFGMPERRGIQLGDEIADELLHTVHPQRLCVAVTSRGGGRYDVDWAVGEGEVAGDLSRSTVIDVTLLYRRVEQAMLESPLRLPDVRDCLTRK